MKPITQTVTPPRYPVSIAILTFNEESRVTRCLSSLKESQAGEIWVIDNGSTDRTREVVDQYRLENPNPPIHFFQMPSNHLGLARRKAVELARFPWVAFTDADCVAPPGWIGKFHDFLTRQRDSKLLAVGGGNVCPRGIHPFYEAVTLGLRSFFGHLGSIQAYRPEMARTVAHLSTCNLFLDRKRLLEAGNFSGDFNRVCEDLELCVRAQAAGFRFLYLPGNDVIHYHMPSLWGWARKMFRYGHGQTLVMRQHPRFALGIKSVPILFLLSFVAAFWISPISGVVACAAYLAAILVLSGWLSLLEKQFRLFPRVAAWFMTTHFCYGAGELAGVLPLIFFWARKWGPNSYRSVVPVTSKPN